MGCIDEASNLNDKTVKESVNGEIISLPRLEYPKIITDPVHGCIQLTELEYTLLQLHALNRLHGIHHLGLAYLVYPAAKTSRFEHSLGVLHLANKMIYQILGSATLEELKEIFGLNPNSETFANDCYIIIQKVRLAALLHDIGHGPYSHVTEPILRKALRDEEIEEAKELFNCKEEKDIPAHEYFTYRMITDGKSPIRKVIESHYENKPHKINVKDVTDLLIKDEEKEDSIRILRKIISSQLDADRMDNLLRDSHATGVPFGLTDIDRVINNIFIDKYEGVYQLIVHERALRGVEDILDARIKMYKSVYSHHLVCALEELLKMAIESMVEEGELKPKYKDFRPENFLKGEIDDTFIYFKLREYQKTHPEFKAFFDRRYIPIALIKRETDLIDFIEETRRKLPIRTSEEEIADNFSRWLEKLKKEEHKQRYKIILLPSSKPFSPYVIKGEERILIGKKGKRPVDLLEMSPYIKSLNEEARKTGKFFRMSFLIPKTQKRNIKEKRIKKVRDLLINDFIKFSKIKKRDKNPFKPA
jgi:HD superfamily phosphohydrolase